MGSTRSRREFLGAMGGALTVATFASISDGFAVALPAEALPARAHASCSRPSS